MRASPQKNLRVSLFASTTLLTLAVAGCQATSAPSVGVAHSVRPLHDVIGRVDAVARSVSFGASFSGALQTRSFGERSSTDGEGDVDLLVTSDHYATGADCPTASADQLCVVVT